MCLTAPGTVLMVCDVYSLAIELSGITNAIITTHSSTIDTDEEKIRGGKYAGESRGIFKRTGEVKQRIHRSGKRP